MLDDVQDLLSREPFRQFIIATTEERSGYIVYSPKQVTVPIHGESIHFRSRDGDTHIIAVRHIVRVTYREGSS